jgi:hypothetical protein
MSIMSMVSAARRELRMRQSIYPKRVADGRMSPEQADHEIRAMEAICRLLDEHANGQWREADHG